MTGTAKQTALFFGFLATAMAHASAEAAPAQPQVGAPAAVQRLMADCGVTERAADARGSRPAALAPKTTGR